jgi:hypothetical protein
MSCPPVPPGFLLKTDEKMGWLSKSFFTRLQANTPSGAGHEPARIEGCSGENFSSTLHEAARKATARSVTKGSRGTLLKIELFVREEFGRWQSARLQRTGL